MKYENFQMSTDGFVGHLVEPDESNQPPITSAVVVIMGGEKSVLPGVKIAERFAEYGFLGLYVSLFGAEGLADGVDQIPIEMFQPVLHYLKNIRKMKKISIYGMSMGTVFAALVARYIGGIDNLILCSPTHVPFAGCEKDKKHMTGHSMATWCGKDIPYVKTDFSSGKMGSYVYDSEAKRKVTRMWIAYRDSYKDKEIEESANLHLEETGARILLIAGEKDEMWPSDYSVRYIQKHLNEYENIREYKVIIYQDAGHLLGVMPSKEKNPWLYRMVPLVGLIYRSIRDNRKACLESMEQSEKEIIDWIRNETNEEKKK